MPVRLNNSPFANLQLYLCQPLRCRLLASIALALLCLCLASERAQAASEAIIPPAVKLNLPAIAYGDEFGHSIAIDGDLIVASAWSTNVGDNKQQGVVYIFARDTNDPLLFNLVKTLTASDSRQYHGFGSAVAIHGDTLVVGAIYDSDNGHFQAGAAYIFERNHGGTNAWGEVKKLVDANFSDEYSEHGYMGDAVAIHGDTVIIGAPKQRGKVFVFERNLGGANQWGEAQVLDPGSYWEGGSFGASLLFDGTRIVIGGSFASMVPARYNNEGAVFIFEKNANLWERTGKLFIADNDPETTYANNSRFGQAIAMFGDTIYVGAPSMTVDDLSLVGEVFVFQYIVDEWLRVGTITPTDNEFGDYFGTSIYAISDGLFIASEKGINGTVHFYQRSGQAATRHTPAVTNIQSWTPIFDFSTTDEVVGSRFGQPLVASGNTFVVGASAYNASQGGVFTYPLDELLTSLPTPPTGLGGSFLPMVAHNPTQVPIETVAGTLANDQILVGPEQFKIGAISNTVTGTVALNIATVAAPATPLPSVVTVQSSHFLLSSDEELLVDIESPFVVSLPVSAGANTSHLALAYLQPAGENLDGDASEATWLYLPGVYDAANNIFLAMLPFLKEDGANLVLVEHPDLNSPLNQSTVQSAATVVKPFVAVCMLTTFPNSDDCTEVMAEEVKTFMDEIYLGMVEQYGFPRKLRLLSGDATYIVSESKFVVALTVNYAIHLIFKGDKQCNNANGSYNPESGFMLICMEKDEQLTDNKKQALIHELFHAIQFTYLKVMQDRQLQRQQDWIIEGTASSAMLSYSAGKMARTPYFGFDNLREVDMPLIQGIANDTTDEEYWAQDFWVYHGQNRAQNLSYLRALLILGGSTDEGIDIAMRAISAGKDTLGDTYWGWVKNQVIEHKLDLGGGPGQSCLFAEESLTNGQPILFPSDQQHYPFSTQWETLLPLTAQVIELQIPHTDTGLLVTVKYFECSALSDPDEQRTCQKALEPLIHAKIYVEGEADCHLEALPGVTADVEGERNISPIVQGQRYFVIVANADLRKDHLFAIVLE